MWRFPSTRLGPFDMPVLSQDAGAHRKPFEAAVRGFFRYNLGGSGWDVQARILRWTTPGALRTTVHAGHAD
jgi:5-methylcytosine-specific restriction enzyme subunit McrC